MSLVTRFSVFFLAALAVALGGFSASLYYVVGIRLRLALDGELQAALDRFPDAPAAAGGRVAWAVYGEGGRRLDGPPGATGPTPLDGRDLGPIAVDAATTLRGPDGLRWRVLARPVLPPRRRGPAEPKKAADRRWAGAEPPREARKGPPFRRDRERERDRRPPVVAAWASLEPLEADLRTLAAVLPLISVGLWALAAAIGRRFGRRALAPLARMASAARAMPWDGDGPTRLPSPGTRDELDDFAGSFNGLLDRFHESLRRQKQFTGQASHQLRTPLAGIIAAVEVARRRDRSAAELERVLDRVHGDATRLWRVVESLLFLARADAEAALPDLEPLDLAGWTGGHLAQGGGPSQARAADVAFERPEGSPLWTRAHPALLGQLLDNLLENAGKYSAPGTPIAVRVWAEPGDASEPARVVLGVEDRGPGIAAADLPHVFEPFFRSDQARKLGQSGVGLGLAIVQRIAAAFGGTVAVESEPGEGTRVLLRLPAADPPGRPDDAAGRVDRPEPSAV